MSLSILRAERQALDFTSCNAVLPLCNGCAVSTMNAESRFKETIKCIGINRYGKQLEKGNGLLNEPRFNCLISLLVMWWRLLCADIAQQVVTSCISTGTYKNPHINCEIGSASISASPHSLAIITAPYRDPHRVILAGTQVAFSISCQFRRDRDGCVRHAWPLRPAPS